MGEPVDDPGPPAPLLLAIKDGTADIPVEEHHDRVGWEPLSTRTMEFDGQTDREIVFDIR